MLALNIVALGALGWVLFLCVAMLALWERVEPTRVMPISLIVIAVFVAVVLSLDIAR